jgi:ABC-type Co2+ transport system permease subunit
MILNKLLFIQGLFYLLTGLWPLIHIQSFMAVTGPKTDVWLVKMVSMLTLSIALVLFSQRQQKSASPLLSMCSALSFLIIDLSYSLNGTISRIYLADAVVEALFVCTGLYIYLSIIRNRIKS